MGRDKSAHGRKKVAVPPGGWQGRKVVNDPSLPRSSTQAKKPILDIHDDDIRKRRIVWRFGEIDTSGPWPPAHIGKQGFANLLEKMASYESMTIGELFGLGSEHGKKYPTETLPSSVKSRLQAIERDDETEIARLSCGGRPRLFGILRENVFHIVWWDPKHEVYPSKKKHT